MISATLLLLAFCLCSVNLDRGSTTTLPFAFQTCASPVRSPSQTDNDPGDTDERLQPAASARSSKMAHSGGRKQPFRALTNAEQATLKQFHEDVHYSHRYTDDDFEYRHVILPKLMLKSIPKDYFDHQSGTLRMLHEDEWRAMGITQVSFPLALTAARSDFCF